MATFTTAPDYGAQLSAQPRVLTAQFGDGYSQRVGDGINIRPRSWSLQFSSRTAAEKNAIVSFLETHNGILSFDWAPPDGASGKFICKSWQVTPQNVVAWTITATFDEVFV